jgi:uncharacterized membrane protein YqjE
MTELQFVGYGLLAGLILYQLWVSVLIYRAAEYDKGQRMAQIIVVWLVPVIGSIGCHLFLRNNRKDVPRSDSNFVRQTPNDAGPMD